MKVKFTIMLSCPLEELGISGTREVNFHSLDTIVEFDVITYRRCANYMLQPSDLRPFCYAQAKNPQYGFGKSPLA